MTPRVRGGGPGAQRLLRMLNPLEWLALAVTILLHFTNLGTIEYFGEDEPWVEFISATFAHHLSTGSWKSALEVLVSGWHPPVRYLVSALGVALFGPSEFGTRFFHACSGIAIFFALRRLMSPAWGRAREATLLLYAVTGPAVLNRLNHGHGMFIALVLWAFVWLEAGEQRRSLRDLVGGLGLLVVAFFTSYEGILFYPYACWRLWKIRRELPLRWLVLTGGILLLPLGAVAGIFAVRGLDAKGMGLGQLTMRGGTVLTRGVVWNVPQKFELYISAMSPFYVAMVLIAAILAWQWMRRRIAAVPESIVRLMLFYAFHIIAWLVVFPGPMSHTLWDYPVWTAFAGWAWGIWWQRQRWVAPAFAATALAMGVLTFEGFNRIGDFTRKVNRFYATMNVPACPSSERWGKRALAARLNDRFGSGETAVTDFGSGFLIAYLRRPVRGDYQQVLADARAGRIPTDSTIKAMVLHSFGKDFESVKASFPFARTVLPALGLDGPSFLVVWFDFPGDRVMPLEAIPATRLAADAQP